MRKYFTLLMLCVLLHVSTAKGANDSLKNSMLKIKSTSIIDKNDRTAIDILNAFYEDVLQAEQGEIQSSTIEKLQDYLKKEDSKNKHLIRYFLIYQQHITDAVEKGLSADPEFQVQTMNLMAKEFQDIYAEIPVIIYIYLFEALKSSKNFAEAKDYIKKGLDQYPKSVPLKVYHYLNTKNAEVKKDLLLNHANHWMVIQNNLKSE